MIKVNLALQGGGAHGAFTWGVLDRLLDEEEIEIAGISGTSAGALNGAAVKAGMARGGREGARDELNRLWTQMGALDDLRIPEWMSWMMPNLGALAGGLEYSLPYTFANSLSQMASPYVWGPMYRNPLERIVEKFNFDDVCSLDGPRLFVCATCVRDGKIRVFTRDKISTRAILASACLPTLFQAVHCEDPETGADEAFWDGGYTGNPALFPLFEPDLPRDVLIVNINPLVREDLPVSPVEIQNRINEISFNSSLLRELRAIAFVQRLIEDGAIKDDAMKNVMVHLIADDQLMNELSVATKLVPLPAVLMQLKEAGRRAAGRFLTDHRDDLGKRQTADLRHMFG
ncbi:patatin-like phospholipase family protein [Pseudoprimorskyibacter insulae]|uniref:PNPLA domain-containing protein n=1 Tax=Pseudoprimorskyibacter insulae TaxID=1695997 RepID=A0A2R8AZ02_9RHOB|nr:patatin-like phospholipase family protein [Pseudoprimorskyibacter insulae]SPF81261.1 hypothetical protein PRI8871_03083 [Pseudoprimorskyibacter insulae]